jgi:hypothetical protein
MVKINQLLNWSFRILMKGHSVTLEVFWEFDFTHTEDVEGESGANTVCDVGVAQGCVGGVDEEARSLA